MSDDMITIESGKDTFFYIINSVTSIDCAITEGGV